MKAALILAFYRAARASGIPRGRARALTLLFHPTHEDPPMTTTTFRPNRPRRTLHPSIAKAVATSPVVESDRTGLPLSDVLDERARIETRWLSAEARRMVNEALEDEAGAR